VTSDPILMLDIATDVVNVQRKFAMAGGLVEEFT
jgi:hypothetical protein